MQIRPYQPADEESLVALWKRCELVRPSIDPHKDILRKLHVNPEWFLVGVLNGQIVASVMAGYEGRRGWLNYVAVDPSYRRRGLGRLIIAEADRLLRAVDCPKINLQVRASNTEAIEFYRKLGYSVDDVISMGKRLVNDEPSQPADGAKSFSSTAQSETPA